MEWYLALLILVGSITGFILIGMPVALAFLTANIIGVLIFLPGIFGMMQIIENSTDLVTKFTQVPVPLFILMGGLFFHTGLARQVFNALDRLLGRIPGRLSFLAVGGGTVFATLTGSSLANAAMLGSLLIPEMQRRRYKPHMAIGPILGVGGWRSSSRPRRSRSCWPGSPGWTWASCWWRGCCQGCCWRCCSPG